MSIRKKYRVLNTQLDFFYLLAAKHFIAVSFRFVLQALTYKLEDLFVDNQSQVDYTMKQYPVTPSADSQVPD